MRALVLLVEDDPSISAVLEHHLRRGRYDVLLAGDEAAFLRLIRAVLPSLVLFDNSLMALSCAPLISRLRADDRTRNIPVLIIESPTSFRQDAAPEYAGRVARLETPFVPRELLSAVSRLLRPPAADIGNEELTVGSLRLDPRARVLYAGHETVRLGTIEFRLLHFLMKHPERVHSRMALLDHVWGESVLIAERTVDVTVRRLRAQLEPSGCDRLVQTVRGAGYRLSVIP